MSFSRIYGEVPRLPSNENYLKYQWDNDICDVYFSATQRGEALSCHFSSNGPGLRHLRKAIDEFVGFMFDEFGWCKMIIAVIEKPSVIRLMKRCDFKHVADTGDYTIYARSREWAV